MYFFIDYVFIIKYTYANANEEKTETQKFMILVVTVMDENKRLPKVFVLVAIKRFVK